MALDRRTLLFAVVAGGLLGAPAAAFKPRTHVWVGQQVLNDLADGCSERRGAARCVTIVTCVNQRKGIGFPWTPDAPCTSREYRVADDVADALMRFPAEYRAGHIGPDTFPDFVVGQMTAHPGIEGGWQTDEWLAWLMKKRGAGDAERAFVYGYLGHAAGDFFAHTYVNTYAGDIFLLTDSEWTVERRHYALEDFIDRHTPPILGPDGHGVAPADLLRVPGSFVADQLILNDDVNGQYRKPGVAADTSHLLAMHGVARALQESIRQTDFAAIESGLLDRIARKEQEIKDAASKVESLAGPIRIAKDQMDAAERVLAEYDRRLAERQKAVKDAEDALTGLIEQKKRAEETIASAPSRRGELNKRLDSLDNDLDKKAKELKKLVKKLCRWNDPAGACKRAKKKIKEARSGIKGRIKDTKRELNKLEAGVQQAKKTLDDLPRRQAEQVAVKKAAEEAIRRLELERKMDRAGQEALEIARKTLAELEDRRRELRDRIASLDLVKNQMLGPLGEVRKIRDLLQDWHADVRKATAAYIEAGRAAGMALVTGTNVLDPYSEWKDCWSPAFAGIPAPVPNSGCVVARAVDELRDLVAKTREEARDLFGQTGGWIVDPLGKLEEEIQKVLIPAVKTAAIEVIGITTDKEWKSFAEILATEYDDENLDRLFGTDESPKNLLLIPGIARRARGDMAVKDNLFSENFAAAYDAVVLSKLALLDAAELNRLAKDCGWRPPSHWGNRLYDERVQSNVLIKAVKSIDGDHAWSPVAPPRPRRTGKDRTPPEKRAYGRPVPHGLRLWASCKARKVVFPGIFRGPLNPGILDLLPKDYPYRPSREDPFPMIIPDCDD